MTNRNCRNWELSKAQKEELFTQIEIWITKLDYEIWSLYSEIETFVKPLKDGLFDHDNGETKQILEQRESVTDRSCGHR